MKTIDRPVLANLVAAFVFLVTTTNRLEAAVATFRDRTGWQTALGSAATTPIDFEGFPEGTPISTQYLPLGVEFLPDNGFLSVIRLGTLDTAVGGQTHQIHFTMPVWAVGWDRTSGNDSYIYQVFDVNGGLLATLNLSTPTEDGGPIFGGFRSDVSIGLATSFSPNDDQRASLDNLAFAPVPEPSTWVLTALGGLVALGVRRSRRQNAA